MDKYELYKQELILQIVKKEIDAFYLIDYVIELCQKIDELDYQLNNQRCIS
ncbi:hypothetical protein R6U77_18200 [Lysinibacillus louembei]|uniref:Uncharacterized protein n=1 Tax=Lysinibacillus louembei TaxID=1470088 RepID=A0ABZ0RWE3_9BACI|nr:hypothetical protein [Lysinibacillus louembei]WPK11800.1 hypothetical protein R6U77_18200 [Lysinibacillus louembei]